MNADLLVRNLIAAALGTVLAAGCARGFAPFVPAAGVAQSITMPAATNSQLPPIALPNFTSLVDKYGLAVVNIRVMGPVKTTSAAPEAPPADPNDPLWQFFRQFQMPTPPPDGMRVSGLGSGFIISTDGVILTNAHVIDGATDVTVKLTSGREYKARVVGEDKHSDVAVIKIDAHDLPTVRLGNSAEVKVGQWVVAIGSPYGFDNTVTSGIISAKGRSLDSSTYVPFLQTNAVVNPGSSGGPLFDLAGDVVGINAQIYSRSGGYQGLSFAIPIEVAVKVKDDLLRYGHVTHGRIGVTIQPVNQQLADAFGLDAPQGVLVSAVDPAGPGAKAGLAPGDIILKLNGKAVDPADSLPNMVADLKPGASATLDVWRDGSTRDVAITIGALKDEVVASTGGNGGEGGRLGVVARPLTPDERQQSGIGSGLVVSEASGAAAAAGIEPGDVILGVNGTAVKSNAQFQTLIAQAGKHVALRIERNDTTIFVPVDLG